MTTKFFLILSLVIVAIHFSFSAAAAPKNVLLYVVDDQGTNDAGCMGNPVIRTPGLDELARDGIRMNYAYATTPSCSASRSVILTGLHNHANGQYGHQHSFHHFTTFSNIKTLPRRMGDAGYRTWSVGKFHVAPQETYPFDKYFGVKSPIEMAEISRPLIESESDDPFFLYFCTTEPHRPFRREGSAPIDPKDVIVPDYLPDTPECRRELARYYMSVERADSGLKRLIKILKDSGHWEDTLIIFISDNGIAFPGAKTNLFEPGVRLPCVVRDPRNEAQGGTSDVMINFTDLTPTILDYADVPIERKDVHGRSFLNGLRNPDVPDRDEVFLSHTFHEVTMYYPVRVVRERQYKLVWNIANGLEFPFASDLYKSETWQGILKSGATHYGKRSINAYLHRAEFELYDLTNDPDELVNLATDDDHVEVLSRLQAKMKEYQKETGDPWISKWEYE